MHCVVIMLLVLVQVDFSYQQNILPEHKRRHCKALQTMDIMEHALPEIRRILHAEIENTRRLHGEKETALKGVILLRCEPGWLYNDNNCYKFSKTRSTWGEAKEMCENMNSYLAEIRSEEENRFAQMELNRLHPIRSWTHDYFLGGYRNDVESKWTWRRTGEVITYANWAPEEPNNSEGDENCLMLQESTAFQWNDHRCNDSYSICQKRVGHKVHP